MFDRRSSARTAGRLLMAVCVVGILAGCATAPIGDAEDIAEAKRINDPAEDFNRRVFAFNLGLDNLLIRPVTGFYRDVIPEPMRRGVTNFLNNLRSPVIFAHDIMQGEWHQAGVTTARFMINSSIGGLGFSDQAADFGLPFHNEDLGQTLAVWGVPEGPFTMSPIIGPSNPRDSFGRLTELLLDPLNFWALTSGHIPLVVTRTLVRGIDARDRWWDVIDDIQRNSLDPYAKARTLYRQRRQNQISNRDVQRPRPAVER